MSSAIFDTLPLELVQTICVLLDAIHRPSLHSFALINKRIRQTAGVALFKNLRLRFNNAQQLSKQVARLTEILRVADSFKHVRRLRLREGSHNARKRARQDLPADGAVSLEQSEGKAWAPLVAFIERLPALADLIYNGAQQFPRELLEVLHTDDHSSCRLHLDDFYLRSLVQDYYKNNEEFQQVDPHELELVSSPNLYAIMVGRGTLTYMGDKYDFNLEAAQQLAAGYSPRLKEVTCFTKRNLDSPASRRAIRRSWPRWPGLPAKDSQIQSLAGGSEKGDLSSLTLGSSWQVSQDELQGWYQRINFAKLRTLVLGASNVETRALQWMAGSVSLSSLSTLELWPPPEDGRATDDFLRALPPLKNLVLGGDLMYFPDAVVDHHGDSLRRLSFLTGGSYRGHLPKLLAVCPLLEDLDVAIPRSGGDAYEVAFYKLLGSHRQLHSISLALDCTVQARGNDFCEDSFGQAPFSDSRGEDLRNGHVRRSLVNSACDSALVESMFRQITAAKPHGSAQLQRLEVHVSHAGALHIAVARPSLEQPRYCNSSLCDEPTFLHLSKKWLVVRHPRDDCVGEVVVEEDALVRKENEIEVKFAQYEDREGPLELRDLEPAFRSLWPKGESDDPRDDWHSFPLAR